MKLLCLAYYFPPEIGSGPHLPYELCESLARRGHDVSVVTGFPRYHVEVMPSKYRRHMFFREEMGGVKVFRVNVPNTCTKQRYLRGATQQVIPWLYALRAMRLEKPDVVFTITPPLALGQAARLVARRFGVPYVVNVQDLFPQNVIDLGMLRQRGLIKFFKWIERGIYRKSSAITVMSEGNRDFVLSKGGTLDRVRIIPNWVDTELIQPGDRINDFSKVHGLAENFIVLFAGTMGWSQGLNVVVDAARLLIGLPDIRFLLVGDGVEKERIQKRSEDLPNVTFLPIQSKDVYPQVLAAGDVALVTLRPEVGTPTVPSKISTIMSAGRPIVASIPLDGDVPKLIAKADCGLVVPPADARALADAILTLKNDPGKTRRLGANGRLYAERHLSRSECVARYEELFRSLVAARGEAAVPGETERNSPVPAVRPAQSADIGDIVKIHLAAFHRGFNLSAFGPRFLKKYYGLFLRFEQSILLVAECAGRVEGFAAGFVNPKDFYTLLKRNKWQLAFAAATAIPTRPSVAVRLFDVARRGSQFMARPETQKPQFCELSSIAVRPSSANRGVGKALIRAFVERASELNAAKVYLTTDAKDNVSTNAFYERLNFTLSDVFTTPSGRVLNEYVLPLSDLPEAIPR
jgi:colanic acid biosynthesis glycosyl transferase WcaI